MKCKNLISVFLLLILTSCIETVAIGGIATAVALSRNKSLVNTKDDIWINSKIIQQFTAGHLKKPGNSIDVIVHEGRVLLTGVVTDAKNAKKAVDICWNLAGVKEVIDEIQVIKNRSIATRLARYTGDASITARLEAKLIFTEKIPSLNYKSTTFNGVVYLIGVGKNSFEIKKVVNEAAKIRGVKKVISHIILENDSRRNN